MIISALESYYNRSHAAGNLPPLGWMYLPLDYILIINKEGELISLMRNFQMDGKRRKRKTAILPVIGKQAIKHTNSGKDPNLLWDNAAFVFGLTVSDTKKTIDQKSERLEHFKNLINTVFLNTNDVGLTAIRNFYEKFQFFMEKILETDLGKSDTITFRLKNDPYPLLQRDAIRTVINNYLESSSETYAGTSIINGQNVPISRNHYAIKGVRDAQGSGAYIVSFNELAFESYGAKKGAISPVGNRTMIAYTTALNYLLRKGSEQRFQVGDASTVFWSAEKTDTDFENGVRAVFGSTPRSINKDPHKYTKAVKSVFKAVNRGRRPDDDRDQEFYVLGLSPNAGRISVRFWIVGTISEIAERIKQHFDYLEIKHSPNDLQYLSLFQLLVNVAVQCKADNIPPNLGGEVMRSILTGRPYPYSFFAAAIQRCKATQSVNYPRAAIIKAYLNRINREENMEEIKVSLDKENPDTAYRLGRLFAALEKIQEEAENRRINTTIRDGYYSSASSNPVSVFPLLLKLTNHHLSKLNNLGRPGQKKNFEKLLGEIMNDIPPDLPATLSLQDQGRFAAGYYHQRQYFFTKKEKPSTEAGESS